MQLEGEMVDKVPLKFFEYPKWIDLAPGEPSIAAYKKLVYELGPGEIRTLGRALGKAVAALEREGDREAARVVHSILAFWMTADTSITAASIVLHEPGADDEDLGYDRRSQSHVIVGDPWRAIDEVKELATAIWSRDTARRARFDAPPPNVYFGLASSLQQRLRQHRNGRFRGRSIRMWPLYETAVPEWVADVEKAVIRWGLGSKRPFHCENEKGGGGGLEGGHGAYWVYLVLAQPE